MLAHLSDLHLTGDGSPLRGVVDVWSRLDAALEVLTSWSLRCDAWVFTGDLSDDGSAASYARLRRRVGEAAAQAGVAVIWANGNHDHRGTFRRVLVDDETADAGPYLAEHQLAGLRILVVDTNVDAGPWGVVGPDALAWLAGRLATPAPHGTLLVLHHAPLPQPQDAAALWPLLNPDAVAEAIRGTDVRGILSGHFHQAGFGTLAGVGVCAAPALSYTQDLTVARDLRGQDAHQGFVVVEVHPGTVVHTVVALDAGAPVGRPLTADQAQREPRPPAVLPGARAGGDVR